MWTKFVTVLFLAFALTASAEETEASTETEETETKEETLSPEQMDIVK